MSTQTNTNKETRTSPLISDQIEPDGSKYTDWNFNICSTLSADELDATLELHPEEDIYTPHLWQAMLGMQRHLDPALQMQSLQRKTQLGYGRT